MIASIKLKIGRTPGAEPEVIAAAPVVVFVGPNNSGKSRLLTEIVSACTQPQPSADHLILERVQFAGVTPDVADQMIAQVTLLNHAGPEVPGQIWVGKQGMEHQIARHELISVITNADQRRHLFVQCYLSYNTMMLDGASRIGMVNSQPSGDFKGPPRSSLQILFRDDSRRATVRRIVHEAFGEYLVVDPTEGGFLRLRLSRSEPHSAVMERGLHEEAIAFYSAALPIEAASDGVKAFTGIVIQLVAGDPTVLAIDEPEAFLHPGLALKLGQEVAMAARAGRKHVYVATHSPNFVMGCIQSGAPVAIVRLTYRDGAATARTLPNERLVPLMRNPLLRSAGVLSALFYECVVVTESDADRAFYQEINERLLREEPSWGIPNCLFINANNKQTVQTIIRPLRDLGIPAAGIVDVDILKEGGSVWTSFLTAGGVPALEQEALAIMRAALKRSLDASGKDMKREGGIDLLQNADREAARNLFARLAEYGLFVVEQGELESWLPHLQVSGHGPAWLVEMFAKMGEDPAHPAYVGPKPNDVWLFIASIRKWLTSPQRKGIPV